MQTTVHFMIYSQNIDQIKHKFWFLSKSLFVEPWYGGLIRPLIGVHPVGISAWDGSRDEILGLWASFWLCFWMNHKEIQNSIFHGMVAGAQQPDLLLKGSANSFWGVQSSHLQNWPLLITKNFSILQFVRVVENFKQNQCWQSVHTPYLEQIIFFNLWKQTLLL